MIERNELELTVEDHRKAFIEVSFLLDMFTATIDDLMGGANATVGRIAGRAQAKKLPIFVSPDSLEEVLKEVCNEMKAGFEITYSCDEDGADVTYKKCALRNACVQRNRKIGGQICKMFHFSFGGIINELIKRPVRSRIIEAGETTCVTRLDVR